jgi:hypothetical protein
MERDRRLDAASREVSCGSAVPPPQAGGHSPVVDAGAGVAESTVEWRRVGDWARAGEA